jgi:tRNA (adenine37-N6)-methyltransferase
VTEPVFRPIGMVHTSATIDEIRERIPGIKSVVEIFPEFEPALEGLDGFSHIFVLVYLNQLRPEQVGPLQVRPKALLRRGLKLEDLPTVGVFALDSPTRPNPIGLSLVPLLRREKNMLHVSDLDYFDSTPVLDIKPYGPNYRVEGYTLSEWRTKMVDKVTKSTQ